VPRILHAIARTGQRELFVLAVFLVCLGTAWATSLAGVSLALGAFLAGLVVAGSDYRHQALSEVIPLREVLTSLFFVSVGMLLDPAALWETPLQVMLLLVAILAGKFLLVLVVGAAMRLPARTTVLTAAAIAQVGEFSFVLFRAAEGQTLLPEPLATELFAAVVLSMLVTPVLLHLAPHIAAGVGRSPALTRVLGVRTPQDAARPGRRLHDHVIVAGYGVAGQELAHALLDAGIPYVIVDLNADNVRQAIRLVEPAFYGDITSPDVLEHLGIREARELVIVINDPDAAGRAVRAARHLSPQVPILVRTRYLAEVPHLVAAGATDVIAAELEASVEITARVLQRHGVQEAVVERHIARVRGRREEEERLDRLESFED
jgi:CPA2 family monovalent cation:H+ antiporter-2